MSVMRAFVIHLEVDDYNEYDDFKWLRLTPGWSE